VIKRDEQYGDKMDVKKFLPKTKVDKIVDKIMEEEKIPF